jgi:N-methylhydantoinase A/oxoprolinase/acetone carboxylase beta subunit
MMVSPRANRMTKVERADLLSLIRKRERVMKTMASERSAQMTAEFEAQAAKIYTFNDDAVWAKARDEAEIAIKAAQRAIEERCRLLGIPREFAPSLQVAWHGRGENAFAWRMAELRRAAKMRIEAIEAEACVRIERMSLDAQAELLSQGLDTDAAQAFLDATKADMAQFMPSLKVAEVEKMIAPTLKRLPAAYH